MVDAEVLKSIASVPQDCDALIRAHQLLREHGHELCKRNSPLCGSCP